jgi:hypothetical protein
MSDIGSPGNAREGGSDARDSSSEESRGRASEGLDELPSSLSADRYEAGLRSALRTVDVRVQRNRRRSTTAISVVAGAALGLGINFVTDSLPPWSLASLLGLAAVAVGGLVGWLLSLRRLRRSKRMLEVDLREVSEERRRERPVRDN